MDIKPYEKVVGAIFAAAIVVMLGVSVYVYSYGTKYIVADENQLPRVSTAIVLGASVASGKPTPVLASRLSTAIDLYQHHRITKILVSGDDTKKGYREAVPMKDALVAVGIPEGDIVVDPQGVDTFSTMQRAKSIYGVTEAIIITQDFHMPRAVYLARSLGIDAYGYTAESPSLVPRYVIREFFADVKAILELTFRPSRGIM